MAHMAVNFSGEPSQKCVADANSQPPPASVVSPFRGRRNSYLSSKLGIAWGAQFGLQAQLFDKEFSQHKPKFGLECVTWVYRRLVTLFDTSLLWSPTQVDDRGLFVFQKVACAWFSGSNLFAVNHLLARFYLQKPSLKGFSAQGISQTRLYPPKHHSTARGMWGGECDGSLRS